MEARVKANIYGLHLNRGLRKKKPELQRKLNRDDSRNSNDFSKKYIIHRTEQKLLDTEK